MKRDEVSSFLDESSFLAPTSTSWLSKENSNPNNKLSIVQIKSLIDKRA